MPIPSEEDTLRALGFVCVLGTVEQIDGKRRVIARGEELHVWGLYNNILVVYDEAKKPWIIRITDQTLPIGMLHSLSLLLSDQRDREQICIPHSNNPEAHDSFVRLFLPDVDEQLIIRLAEDTYWKSLLKA